MRPVISELLHANALDALAQHQCSQRHEVARESRIDAAREQGRSAVPASGFERASQLGTGTRRMNQIHHRRRDDILAGSQQASDLSHCVTSARFADGRVDGAVRRGSQQTLRVVRRVDSSAHRQAGQLPRVAPDLVWAVHVHSDELE